MTLIHNPQLFSSRLITKPWAVDMHEQRCTCGRYIPHTMTNVKTSCSCTKKDNYRLDYRHVIFCSAACKNKFYLALVIGSYEVYMNALAEHYTNVNE
jgi:hypothetical protein